MSTNRTGLPNTSSGRSCERQAAVSASGETWLGSSPIPAAPARATAATRASTSAGAIAASAMPVVSRNSPPRSIPVTAGVSNTCTHSTRFPSRWPAATTLTSALRSSSSASTSATVRTECPDSSVI